MWDQKQNNVVFSGRVTGPFRSQVPHDGSTRVPAPSDVSDREYLVESSRKRKAVAMDRHGKSTSDAISQPLPRNHWHNESNHQHKFGVLSSMDEQGNNVSGFSNFTAASLDSGAKLFQPRGYGSEGLNTHISGKNHPKVSEEMEHLHASPQPHAFQQKDTSNSIKPTDGKIPTLPNSHSTPSKFRSQIEAHKPHPDLTDTGMNRALSRHGPLNGVEFGHTNHVVIGKSSIISSLKTPEPVNSDVSQPNSKVLNYDVNSYERVLSENLPKTGSSFEMKQSGQASGVAIITGISTFGTSSLETACLEGNVNKSFQNCDSQATTGGPNNGLTSQLKVSDQTEGGHGTQVLEGKEGLNMEIGNHSLGADGSAKTADYSTSVLNGQQHQNDSQHVALKFVGERKSHAEKATLITEKLWDGSLQLSASMTVSAVAFFKSGEKAPEIKWSKSIVVKGKVRLEAFERFIQELPRSRSRGLMVTSLCWKVGSSETGLAGMKEAAKGYKEYERVGFAQLSRGIDLYVCPRSDAIITILAKYGFFKGMAALEEDQDSFIGCVVWRRYPSSDSVAKKIKDKMSPLSDKPLVSILNPVTSQMEKDNTRSIHSGERYSPLVPENCSVPVSVAESKCIQSSEVPPKVENSTSNISREKTEPVPNSAPAISVELNSSVLSGSWSPISHTIQEVKTPTMQTSGHEKPHADLELPQPVRPSLTQNVTEDRPAPDDDDDDLPEFDFGTACGISQHSVSRSPLPSTSAHVSDVVPIVMKVPAEGTNNVSGLMPPQTAAEPVVTISQQRSQAITYPSVSGVSQPNNPAPKFGEVEALRPALSFPAEKPMALGQERSGQPGVSNSTTSTALPTRKNLWDDDMPEWCPPDLGPKVRPTMISTTRPPVPSPVPNKLPPPPATMSTTRPSFTYTPFPASNNKLEGPTPTCTTTWPSNSYIPSPDPDKRSENLPTCPSPIMTSSRGSSSCTPFPITNQKSENRSPGRPTMGASNPSTSYVSSPVDNRGHENKLPAPSPHLSLPHLPPPVSTHTQFHTPESSRGHQSSMVGARPPIGPNFAMGFTYNPTSRPPTNTFDIRPPTRPAGWRDPRH